MTAPLAVGPVRAPRSAVRLPRALPWVLAALPLLVTIVALLAPELAPDDPVQPVGALNLPVGSAGHLLGTDSIGRDLLSRTLLGMRVSWFSSLLVVAVGLLVGGTIGTVAGAVGGWVDAVLMRVTDLFLALPGTLVAIAIVAALGPGLAHTLVAISVVWWPYYARILRGEVRALVVRPHVEAARVAGAGRWRVIAKHLLPGVIPTAVVTASLDIGNVVLLLAGLSFLGLGEPAPAPELGADTARALGQLLSEWWVPVVPGLAVLLLSLVSNLGGDAVRTLLAGRR
ncbi:peptide/nickel transport system permease protein [Motilibacter rhizosphaerae]|uniref:Peptide/nickel transport system permease protein n=1 Tax=Motilibacter rhizosphaerae TaxID=598652 RepID=A0A4V2F4L2_9ACTN|nr:ABC transporter permease [Motilibacter rhizosphaerae]RZS89709.1 peptide/nickel transport system permease protein [Motilibacter rhizosphaerae]